MAKARSTKRKTATVRKKGRGKVTTVRVTKTVKSRKRKSPKKRGTRKAKR